jgi:hypothetical protein
MINTMGNWLNGFGEERQLGFELTQSLNISIAKGPFQDLEKVA